MRGVHTCVDYSMACFGKGLGWATSTVRQHIGCFHPEGTAEDALGQHQLRCCCEQAVVAVFDNQRQDDSWAVLALSLLRVARLLRLYRLIHVRTSYMHRQSRVGLANALQSTQDIASRGCCHLLLMLHKSHCTALDELRSQLFRCGCKGMCCTMSLSSYTSSLCGRMRFAQ